MKHDPFYRPDIVDIERRERRNAAACRRRQERRDAPKRLAFKHYAHLSANRISLPLYIGDKTGEDFVWSELTLEDSDMLYSLIGLWGKSRALDIIAGAL